MAINTLKDCFQHPTCIQEHGTASTSVENLHDDSITRTFQSIIIPMGNVHELCMMQNEVCAQRRGPLGNDT